MAVIIAMWWGGKSGGGAKWGGGIGDGGDGGSCGKDEWMKECRMEEETVAGRIDEGMEWKEDGVIHKE